MDNKPDNNSPENLQLPGSPILVGPDDIFPGFDYMASDLSAFVLSIECFIISLKNGRIVHFSPRKPEAFTAWLKYHKIRDIDEGMKKLRE